MKIETVSPEDRQVIQGYGDGGFRVSGTRHEGPLLVFPDHVETWLIEDPARCDTDSLRSVLDAPKGVEILLFGAGIRASWPPNDVRAALRSQSVALEVMDTGAACRTYNVLMAENRLVVAALMPI